MAYVYGSRHAYNSTAGFEERQREQDRQNRQARQHADAQRERQQREAEAAARDRQWREGVERTRWKPADRRPPPQRQQPLLTSDQAVLIAEVCCDDTCCGPDGCMHDNPYVFIFGFLVPFLWFSAFCHVKKGGGWNIVSTIFGILFILAVVASIPLLVFVDTVPTNCSSSCANDMAVPGGIEFCNFSNFLVHPFESICTPCPVSPYPCQMCYIQLVDAANFFPFNEQAYNSAYNSFMSCTGRCPDLTGSTTTTVAATTMTTVHRGKSATGAHSDR